MMLPPKFGVTYSVPIRFSMFICSLLFLLSLLPGIFLLRWRCGETCGTSCSRKWVYEKSSRRKCSWFCDLLHVLLAPFGFIILWVFSRFYYFMKYLYLIPQFKFVLIWYLLLIESIRSFSITTLVYAQRKVKEY
jgi:hypothetical protein